MSLRIPEEVLLLIANPCQTSFLMLFLESPPGVTLILAIHPDHSPRSVRAHFSAGTWWLEMGPCCHFTVLQHHFREGLWIRKGGSRLQFQHWAEWRRKLASCAILPSCQPNWISPPRIKRDPRECHHCPRLIPSPELWRTNLGDCHGHSVLVNH